MCENTNEITGNENTQLMDCVKKTEEECTESKEEKRPPEGKEVPKKKKKKTARYFAMTFFIKIGITVLVIVLLLNFVVGIHVNHSNSAYPMIKDGDLCVTFRLGRLSTGDEIVYRRDGEVRFGRIVAMPGNVVEVSDNVLMVNGFGLYENTVYPTPVEGSKITYPYTVPEDTVFVLNDYRSDLKDSRTYGGIPLSDTEGKVILVIRRRGI